MVRFLQEEVYLLDVRIKTIIAFQIWKLTSLEDFEFPNGSVLVTVASAGTKRLLSILVIFWKRVFLSARYLGQWGRKWHVKIFFCTGLGKEVGHFAVFVGIYL